MSPPPRPPVICYDLTPNPNPRRAQPARSRVLTSQPIRVEQKPKITFVRRDIRELERARPLPRRLPDKRNSNYVKLDEIATNTASSSSTISISSCSSPDSIDDVWHSLYPSSTVLHNNRSVQTSLPASDLKPMTVFSSSPVKRDVTIRSPMKDFSFYKGNLENKNETLEVTDMDFFEKVEDKSMLEVNELFKKMQSVLKDLERCTKTTCSNKP